MSISPETFYFPTDRQMGRLMTTIEMRRNNLPISLCRKTMENYKGSLMGEKMNDS